MLCERIPGFENKLEPLPGQNPSVAIHLKKADSEAFAIIIDYLFCGKLETTANQNALSNDELILLCNLLSLAEYLQLEELSAAVLERVKGSLKNSRQLPTAKEIHHIFETPNAQGLQQLVLREVLTGYLNASVDQFRREIAEWSAIVTSHPIFHDQFLVGLKLQNAGLQGRASNKSSSVAVTPQKRKASGEGETSVPPGSPVVDLTEPSASK